MNKDKSQKKIDEQEYIELENNWKRALADYQNLQKRVLDERESFIRFANTNLILRILPVLDNMHMILKHNADDGLKMTIKEFEKVLIEEGLEEIKADGMDFDSSQMDAIEMVDGEEGKVVEVVQKGYLLKNKILRPARVKVGQKQEEK